MGTQAWAVVSVAAVHHVGVQLLVADGLVSCDGREAPLQESKSSSVRKHVLGDLVRGDLKVHVTHSILVLPLLGKVMQPLLSISVPFKLKEAISYLPQPLRLGGLGALLALVRLKGETASPAPTLLGRLYPTVLGLIPDQLHVLPLDSRRRNLVVSDLLGRVHEELGVVVR